MKKVFIVLFLILAMPMIVKAKYEDYVYQGYYAYIGEYFLNKTPKTFLVDIGRHNDSLYILEKYPESHKLIMYICDDISDEGNRIFMKCDDGNNNVFIKIIKDKLKVEDEEQDIFYVSVSDNEECTNKYNSPLNFEKYCNPETNKDIKFLNLYNLHKEKS